MAILFDDINRLITIEAPEVEVTCQNLLNAVREFEYSSTGIDDPQVAGAAGKEALGGGVYVGITVTLYNWRVQFEARPGPDWVLCNVSGGNLVAVDENGDFMQPINPTAYVSYGITASSSATLSELTSIQYSSFGGGITVDILSSYSGTTFPVGTPQEPVNNLADAMLIADERGFGTLYIIGDITVDSSGNYDGMVFVGESQTKSILTISTGASVIGCEFRDAEILGVLDGNSLISNCILSDLDYVYGIIIECILEPGTITLAGANPAHFLDCWSGNPGADYPIIDCGGSGQALALQNYNGRIKIQNKTGSDELSIALNAGEIYLDTTITNGNIEVRGIGDLDDFSTGSAVVDSSALISSYLISTTTWDSVYIDTDYGEAGTEYPLGTARSPVDNLNDAVTISNRENIEEFRVHGLVTLSGSYADKSFVSHSPGAGIIIFSGGDVSDSSFFHTTLSGTLGLGEIHAHQCQLLGLSNLKGEFHNCTLAGDIVVASGNSYTGFFSGQSLIPTNSYIVDVNGSCVAISKYIADITVKNVNDPTSCFSYQGAGAVTLDNSNTDGSARVAGELRLVDNSAGTTVYNSTIRATIWNALLSDYEVANTFGEAMADLIKLTGYKVTKSGDVITIYEANGSTVWRQYNLASDGRVEV